MLKWTALIFAAGLALSPQPCPAHIVSTDCVIQLIVEPEKAKAEVWVPISGIAIWKAAIERGNDLADPVPDPLALAKERAAEVLKGLTVSYGERVLTATLKETTVQSLWAGLSQEDTEPQPMAVYTVEYAPEKPIKAPAEITVEQNLLSIPEGLSLDRVTTLMVRYRQADQKDYKTDVIAQSERVTYKPKWKPAPTTAPKPTAGN
jgi:hypothetical protein